METRYEFRLNEAKRYWRLVYTSLKVAALHADLASRMAEDVPVDNDVTYAAIQDLKLLTQSLDSFLEQEHRGRRSALTGRYIIWEDCFKIVLGEDEDDS